MLTVSEQWFDLSNSPTRQRFFILLYLITLVILLGSGLHGFVKFILAVMLILQSRSSLKRDIARLGVATQWMVETMEGDQLVFDSARVLVDTDFFIVLALRSALEQRVFMIFNDQLIAKEYSLLRIIEKQKTDMHLQEKAVIE